MAFFGTLPFELIEKILQCLPVVTLKDLLGVGDRIVAGIAERCYYSDVVVVLDSQAPHTVVFDDNRVVVPLARFEELVDQAVRFRDVTFKLSEGNRYFYLKRYTRLALAFPSFKVVIEVEGRERYTRDDLVPVHDKVADLVVRCYTIDPTVPLLPTGLKRLNVRVNNGTPWSPLFNTLVFPVRLSSLVVSGEWVPMVNWGPLPPSVRTLLLHDSQSFTIELFNNLELGALKTLRLGNLSAFTQLDDRMHLPDLLEELCLTNRFLTTISRGSLPRSLERLEISYCPLLVVELPVLPTGLKALTVFRTSLSSSQLHALVLPESLKRLQVCCCNLEDFGFLRSLPNTLEHLDLQKNKLGRVGGVEAGEDEGATRIRDRPVLAFPQRLRTLNLGGNRDLFRLYHPLQVVLPEGLLALHLGNTGLESVANVVLPALLVSLVLCENRLQEFSLVLPTGLRSLNLQQNQISEFLVALPKTLGVLLLSNNALVEVALTLPPVCKALNLSGNPLRRVCILNAADPALSLRRLDIWGVTYEFSEAVRPSLCFTPLLIKSVPV